MRAKDHIATLDAEAWQLNKLAKVAQQSRVSQCTHETSMDHRSVRVLLLRTAPAGELRLALGPGLRTPPTCEDAASGAGSHLMPT